MLALLNQLAVSFDLPILDWIQAHLQCAADSNFIAQHLPQSLIEFFTK